MTKHTHQSPLLSYHQIQDVKQTSHGREGQSCYLVLACVSRHLCKPSFIVTFLVTFLLCSLIWVIVAINGFAPEFKKQIQLNQARHLDGRWDDYRREMLTVYFQGRLGNEMFQYAAVYCEARLQRLRPVVQDNQELWSIFSLSAIPLKSKLMFRHPWKRVTETIACGLDPNIEHLDLTHNIQLYGFFQSWKYCSRYENELRQEFHLADYLLTKAVTFLLRNLRAHNLNTRTNKIAKTVQKLKNLQNQFNLSNGTKALTIVGIHVRQGDMVHNPEMVEYGYTTPNMSYYDGATDYFRKKYGNVLFIVCTDGLDWVKKNMHYNDMIVSEGNTKEVDMAILSLCDHTIISVGSFGWWSGWLTNGEVVYYNDWPLPNSKLEALVNKTEYFPPNWIPMTR